MCAIAPVHVCACERNERGNHMSQLLVGMITNSNMTHDWMIVLVKKSYFSMVSVVKTCWIRK